MIKPTYYQPQNLDQRLHALRAATRCAQLRIPEWHFGAQSAASDRQHHSPIE